MDVEPIDNANCILIGKEADFVKAVIRVRAAAFRAVSHLSLYPDNPPFTARAFNLSPDITPWRRGILMRWPDLPLSRVDSSICRSSCE
ncbi:MAG: hypothetical protein ABSD12_23610 [Paraburkholderia sp.]|jgi:hypothetical protein